jgi:hypothetical protein
LHAVAGETPELSFSGGASLLKFLEVAVVIVLPLAYGLAVSGFFHWLHRRRSAVSNATAAATGNGNGSGSGPGAGEAGK